MNAAAKTSNAATRRTLNERLVIAIGNRKSLNRTRGPLGHGVIVHADKDTKMATLDAEIADLRAALAALA